jgi:hypothetical protein
MPESTTEEPEVIPPLTSSVADYEGAKEEVSDELSEILTKHIRCTETGIIFQGEMPLEKWVKGFEFFQKLGSKSQWWRGDMLNEGERKYGESYAQAIDIHGKSESRLQTYCYVCTKFPIERRRPEISFDHHAEAASLEPREADALLLRAIRERWSKMDVRAEVARINERNGVPKRGRKSSGTAAKIAASGKQPVLAIEGSGNTMLAAGATPTWNGHTVTVKDGFLTAGEPIPFPEADSCARHHGFADAPAMVAALTTPEAKQAETSTPAPQQAASTPTTAPVEPKSAPTPATLASTQDQPVALERCQAALNRFEEATREVDWKALGALARKSWLKKLIFADSLIDLLQSETPATKKETP